MAKPQESYPETATNGARKATTNEDGKAALQDALAVHGETLAALIEETDELDDALTTAMLVAATAEESELDRIVSSISNLIEAADGLSTEEAAELAAELGDNADDLSASLNTILELQQDGHLDDLVTIVTAFAESLSPEEIEELSTMVEEDGGEIVGALDTLLDLQREGHLNDLIGLAKTLSALEIDEDAVQGLNTVLAAVGEAERGSKPRSFVGMIRQIGTRDARSGFGYLVAVLKAHGRRLRNQYRGQS